MSSITGIASVPRQAAKPDKKNLDPRATRYGLIPIWAQQVAARDFYVWTIPANNIFPFRPFIGEIGQDTKGNETYRVERLPEDQIGDLRRMTKYFTELPELARLSEEAAEAVAAVLLSPKPCSKYAIELGNQCSTCWMEYLYSDEITNRINSELEGNDLKRAANASIPALRQVLRDAIDEARRLVDEAVREIDDPTKGKKQFYEQDYLNIYHTHAERPKYKTSTSSTDSAQAIAEAIKAIAQPQAPAFDPKMIADMVAAAVAEATAPLKAKLDEYEKPAVQELIDEKAAKVKEKIEKAKD